MTTRPGKPDDVGSPELALGWPNRINTLVNTLAYPAWVALAAVLTLVQVL